MGRDIKDIKKDILDKFRDMNGEEDDILPEDWLVKEYLPFLNNYERRDFERAIRQLQAKGVLKLHLNGRIPKLSLTEKGANLIH